MRISAKTIQLKKKKREKIVVLTAYDALFARLVDESGADIILVGDSLGMVLLGYESTVPVTMRDMLHHTRAASRGVRRALLCADMPFGSYDTPAQALRNARRFLKQGGADAVKVEGGSRIRHQIETLRRSGIPVMGHLGMTPQTATELGGYVVQGKKKADADRILREAGLLDRLGVFALVLECVPQTLARRVARAVKCPVIGIGAGPGVDGQVLVLHDMLGIDSGLRPRFVRRYAELGKAISGALKRYGTDVRKGSFPSAKESY